MYISRKGLSVDILLIGAILCVGGCISASKPQLSAAARAEALSHFSLGLLAVSGGDYAVAFDHFEQAIQNDPDEATLYSPAIALALDMDRKNDAVRLVRMLVKHHPASLEHQLLLAKVYTLTEHPDLAERLLRNLQIDFPEDPDVPVLLTQICLSQKRQADAIELLRTAVAVQGDNHELLLLLGALCIDCARPMDDSPLQKEAIEDGIHFLQRAVSLAPEDSSGWQQLGFAFLAMEQPDEALAAFQEARKRSPADLLLARQVLDILVQTGKYDEAISECSRLATETGTKTEWWFHYLAEILPEKELDRLIQYLEAQINLPLGTFYYQYATFYERAGQLEQAEKLFFKVIESGEQPLVASAQNYLAYTWAERGEKLETGLNLIQAALQTDPENGAFLDTLGWIYYKLEQYENALHELKKALDSLGDDPTVLEHLGDTYLKLGRNEAAVEQWEKALKIEPESPLLLERIKKHKGSD